MSRPARRPYWMVVAFAALMLIPPPAAIAVLVLAVAAMAAVRFGRELARRRALEQASEHAIVLGADRAGNRVLLGDDQLGAHGLILGASGAGKTTTLLRILTEQIARGRGVVAIDLKGSPAFARELASAAADAGRPFLSSTPD